MKRWRNVCFYVGYVVAWIVAIVATGAAVGAISFPLVGWLAGSSRSAASHALSGARQLAFLAFIWAPGIAIVLAIRRAWERRQSASLSVAAERPGTSSS
jgi:hypothetical protein